MSQKNNLGFTLIELLVAISILAVTLTVTLSYIFIVRQKAILVYETDKLISAFEYARQQSIIAYRGNQYAIRLDPTNHSFTILPENKTSRLKSSVRISHPSDPTTYTFATLTGKPNSTKPITLHSGGLKVEISISPEGFISANKPKF